MFYKEFTKNSRMLRLNKNKMYFISKNKGNLILNLLKKEETTKIVKLNYVFLSK